MLDGGRRLEIVAAEMRDAGDYRCVVENVAGQIDRANIKNAENQINRITQALEFYKLDNKRFPNTDQGLDALVNKPSAAPVPKHYDPEKGANLTLVLHGNGLNHRWTFWNHVRTGASLLASVALLVAVVGQRG